MSAMTAYQNSFHMSSLPICLYVSVFSRKSKCLMAPLAVHEVALSPISKKELGLVHTMVLQAG